MFFRLDVLDVITGGKVGGFGPASPRTNRGLIQTLVLMRDYQHQFPNHIQLCHDDIPSAAHHALQKLEDGI